MKLKRFLMNEADSSPGGGGVPAPATPAATAGAATPNALSAADITSAVATQLAEFKNGFFADLRKAGALKQEKPTVEHPPPGATPQQLPGSPSAASGLSVADVEAMLERERVITARSVEHKLTDAQVRRMKSALSGTSVDVFAHEADSYLSEMGLVKATPPPATATQTATLTPDVPRSPAAAPSAPTGHGLPLLNGIVDIFSLSEEQRKAMGPSSMRAVLEQLQNVGNQQSGIPARPKPPSQR